jgi:hypothetical protein
MASTSCKVLWHRVDEQMSQFAFSVLFTKYSLNTEDESYNTENNLKKKTGKDIALNKYYFIDIHRQFYPPKDSSCLGIFSSK